MMENENIDDFSIEHPSGITQTDLQNYRKIGVSNIFKGYGFILLSCTILLFSFAIRLTSEINIPRGFVDIIFGLNFMTTGLLTLKAGNYYKKLYTTKKYNTEAAAKHLLISSIAFGITVLFLFLLFLYYYLKSL